MDLMRKKFKIKKWMIGTIIGFIWGIILMITIWKTDWFNTPSIYMFTIGIPFVISIWIGTLIELRGETLFITPYFVPIVSILIGTVIGYILDRVKT